MLLCMLQKVCQFNFIIIFWGNVHVLLKNTTYILQTEFLITFYEFFILIDADFILHVHF